MVEISREERDAYLIPQNFVDTGTILGGTVKLRNAVEAAVLAVGSAIPLFYLPMAFNIRLMIVIAVSVPLGVFGVVGIGGDSLTQFVAHWFRFMKRRRIVTPTPQGNLEANRHRHLRLISKRYRVVYYDDSDTLPHNAQVLQRKADRHGKLVKRQTLYDLLPIEKIENGILHTTDDRYIKILEIEPINFLLRSPREQRSVIYSFASLLKVSPVRLQFKSFSRKADVNAYLDKLRRDAANEPDAAVRKRHMSYIRFVKRLGSRDAVSRRFFVIFQYEAPTNERNISYAEIVSTLETTARNFRTYLAQCGNAIVEHENEDEFITDVFYTLLNRRTAVQVPLQERIQDVLASYLAQNDATALDKIPPAAFMIPPSLDLKHGRYLYMDGIYHAYLMIPADGYRAQVIAGWMALLVNAGDGIDVDLFLERQPKERMMQKIGQQIRINRSKIKDTSDTNSDFDDLSNAIRSGYYLKDGLANNEDFYYAAILVTVTAASVKDLEWRIGEIRKLMVSQDMNLQLCSFRQEAAFLSSLPLCAPDTALFKKYRRNILTSTAASFYPFVSFELCDTNGVLLGVNKYNNSLVSLDNFSTRIYKNANIGNVLTGYENGQFVYETDNLANATYEIHAQGDIPTPDNQGTLWYADGDLVATVTTDGQVDEVQFSPTRTTATYDFLKVTHDGTKGEVAITLPLGTYTISEVQAPYGYVHTDHTYTVVLDWDNQYNDLVLAKTIIDHTQDGDVVYNYSIINAGNASAEQIEKQVLVFENSRVLPVVEEGKVGVGLYKLDRDTCDLTDEKPYADGCKTRASLLNGSSNRADIPADAKMVAGAVYELYTADDIYSISGELLAAADTLLGTATTDENGLAYFDVDVPLRGEHYGSSDAHDWTTNSGRYYLREVSVPDGYLIEQSVIPVEFTYENQFIAFRAFVFYCVHWEKAELHPIGIDKRTIS